MRHLRSDMTDEEKYFLLYGECGVGSTNNITCLFKLVGRFNELNDVGRGKEVLNYIPENDLSFKYENRGYTIIRDLLKQHTSHYISRRYLKNLSRKWKFHPAFLALIAI